MIDYLIQTLDPADEDLTANIDWYLLPVVNPDGYDYTFTDDRHWRKTRSIIPGNACLGVDANRNFGYEWSLVGASDVSCADTYHGPEAWSEVEITNIRDYIYAQQEQGVNIVYYQSMHSAANLIMYPWGYSCSAPNPDAADQDSLGEIVKK